MRLRPSSEPSMQLSTGPKAVDAIASSRLKWISSFVKANVLLLQGAYFVIGSHSHNYDKTREHVHYAALPKVPPQRRGPIAGNPAPGGCDDYSLSGFVIAPRYG